MASVVSGMESELMAGEGTIVFAGAGLWPAHTVLRASEVIKIKPRTARTAMICHRIFMIPSSVGSAALNHIVDVGMPSLGCNPQNAKNAGAGATCRFARVQFVRQFVGSVCGGEKL